MNELYIYPMFTYDNWKSKRFVKLIVSNLRTIVAIVEDLAITIKHIMINERLDYKVTLSYI